MATLNCFEDLIGHTIVKIEGQRNDDQLIFTIENGERYIMHHHQDCCENVWLEDITGTEKDILNKTILKAEEVTNSELAEYGSRTWTFYHITTFLGTVTLRWCGESNGYYSESVSFELVD